MYSQCESAVKRINYQIVWVDANIDSDENQVYKKIIVDLGYQNFKTINNTEEFQQNCMEYLSSSDVYIIVNGMWAETVIKILSNQIKYQKKINKIKKRKFNA